MRSFPGSGRFRPLLKSVLVAAAALAWLQALVPSIVRAQENDPGLIRALETDSASVENAYYLWTYLSNDASPGQGLYLYGEGVATLWKDWGLVADFPTLLTRQPLGQVPMVLGAVGLSLRWEAFHFGGWDSQTAGAFSLQAGGAYGVHNDTFYGVGSSWTLKALAGYKMGRVFVQGDYGYQGGLEERVPGRWRADTSVGCSLGSDWYVQGEADFTALPGESSWAFIPQLAFQPGEWLFELGEVLNDGPAGATEVLAARTF